MSSTLFSDNPSNTKETKSILLVDDSESTNFFNKIVIERNVFTKITTAINGIKAIEHIKSLLKNDSEVPQFIFLDINMPEMDGWEFLKAYTSLTPKYKNSKIILNSTLDLNEYYEPKIKELGITNYAFTEKMMTRESIEKLIV